MQAPPARYRRRVLALALLAATTTGLQDPAAEQDSATRAPSAALRALVDLPDAAARAAAAAELAARADVTLAGWLEAARAFGRFAPDETGERLHRVELPAGAAVETTDLHVYVPARYDPGTPAPLVLVGHGTGGSGEGLVRIWRRVADELGMLLLAPSEAGPNIGYAFSDRERSAALAAIRWARRRWNVDENRIFATGISRGGHLAWDLALRFPDRFAGIVPLIGGPRLNPAKGQNNLRYVENVAALAIRDLQGSRDDARLVFNVRYAFAKLQQLRARDAKLVEFPELGHSFELSAVDWSAFFAGARRSPVPLRVARAYARPGEGRAGWLEVLGADRSVTEEVVLRVEEAEWKRLEADEEAMRRFLDERTAACTARAEASRLGGNRFDVRSEKVTKLRLLLAEDMFAAQEPVRVEWNGRTTSRRVAMSKAVLLREFAERFDRTFLPVAELVLSR